jgi:predicted secreted protein
MTASVVLARHYTVNLDAHSSESNNEVYLLNLHPSDSVQITATENPSTGYTW